jgi:hypothetical protein
VIDRDARRRVGLAVEGVGVVQPRTGLDTPTGHRRIAVRCELDPTSTRVGTVVWRRWDLLGSPRPRACDVENRRMRRLASKAVRGFVWDPRGEEGSESAEKIERIAAARALLKARTCLASFRSLALPSSLSSAHALRLRAPRPEESRWTRRPR